MIINVIFKASIFYISYHFNSCNVVTAIDILSFKKGVNKVSGKSRANHSFAKAKHVCVIMLARESCGEGVRAAGSSYTLVFVSCHRHSDTCSADKNAKRALTALNLFAKRVSVYGIMTAVRGVCSNVNNLVSLILNVFNYHVFNRESCVIAANCYLHFAPRLGCFLFC